MEPRTVLKCLRGRADFVYGDVRPSCRANGENWLGLEVRPYSNCCALSSGGGNLAPSHSQSAAGPSLASFPIHAMRGRVNTPRGTKVQVARKTGTDGKQHGTKSRTAFRANWNRRRPWTNIARICHVSSEAVPRAVDMPVARHRADAGQEGMGALGVDETAWRVGYRDRSEVHWHAGQGGRPWEGRSAIAREGRVPESGSGLGQRRADCGGSGSVRRQAYSNTVSRRAGWTWSGGAGAGTGPRARQLGEMVGRVGPVGASERKRQSTEPMLGLTCRRWRRAERATDKWQLKLTDLPNLNLRTMRMDWLNEETQPFRNGGSLRQAHYYRPSQCRLTMCSRLAPMQNVACGMCKYRPFPLNGYHLGRVCASAVRGVERQGETSPRKSVQVQIRRIPHSGLGSSLGRSSGTRTRPHLLLTVEFYQQKPNKESTS